MDAELYNSRRWLMPMIHVSEISAEKKPYQKTGIINRHENRACYIRHQKLLPEKFVCTKLHVRRVRNRYRFSGAGFWCRKCVMGIRLSFVRANVSLSPTEK